MKTRQNGPKHLENKKFDEEKGKDTGKVFDLKERKLTEVPH